MLSSPQRILKCLHTVVDSFPLKSILASARSSSITLLPLTTQQGNNLHQDQLVSTITGRLVRNDVDGSLPLWLRLCGTSVSGLLISPTQSLHAAICRSHPMPQRKRGKRHLPRTCLFINSMSNEHYFHSCPGFKLA